MLGIITKLLYLLALTPFEAQALTITTHRVKSDRRKDSRKSIEKNQHHGSRFIESSAFSSNSTATSSSSRLQAHHKASNNSRTRNKTSSTSRLTNQKEKNNNNRRDESTTTTTTGSVIFQLPAFNFKSNGTSSSHHGYNLTRTATVHSNKKSKRTHADSRNETVVLHHSQNVKEKGQKKKEKKIETKILPLPETAVAIHHKKPEEKDDKFDVGFTEDYSVSDAPSFYDQFRFFNLGCSAVMSVLAYFFSLDVELLREQADERDDDDDSLVQNRLWYAKKVEYFHWLSAYFYFSGFLFAKQDDPDTATIWQILGLTSQFGGLVFAGVGIFDIVKQLELNGDTLKLV